MFRLVKLMAYALLGYAMYEFFRGMTEECGAQGRSQLCAGNSAQQHRRGQNLTGAGRGSAVATQDPTGASATHVVGRGVTH